MGLECATGHRGSVDNINRNAYPGVSRSGSGEGAFSSSPSNGFRPKRIRSRFNR